MATVYQESTHSTHTDFGALESGAPPMRRRHKWKTAASLLTLTLRSSAAAHPDVPRRSALGRPLPPFARTSSADLGATRPSCSRFLLGEHNGHVRHDGGRIRRVVLRAGDSRTPLLVLHAEPHLVRLDVALGGNEVCREGLHALRRRASREWSLPLILPPEYSHPSMMPLTPSRSSSLGPPLANPCTA